MRKYLFNGKAENHLHAKKEFDIKSITAINCFMNVNYVFLKKMIGNAIWHQHNQLIFRNYSIKNLYHMKSYPRMIEINMFQYHEMKSINTFAV